MLHLKKSVILQISLESSFATQGYSYDFAIYKAIKARKTEKQKLVAVPETQEKYIFIIDEIKVIRQDMEKLDSAAQVHVAQALCYAYMYAKVLNTKQQVLQKKTRRKKGFVLAYKSHIAIQKLKKSSVS